MQKYQLLWEEDHVFEVDAPSTDEYPLGSISADELREKYVYNSKNGGIKDRNTRDGKHGANLETLCCALRGIRGGG